MKDIKNEWIGTGISDEASGEVHCQLCGRKNKYVYYIRNIENKKELNVGSDCIKYFSEIKEVKKLRKNYRTQVNERNKIQRQIEFDGIDLDDIDFIKKAGEWFANFPILLSHSLYEAIKEVLYNLNFIRTNYINEGNDIKIVKRQYFDFKKEFKMLQEKALDFYEKN